MARITKQFAIFLYVALIAVLPGFDFMPEYISYHDGMRLLELLLLCLVLLYGGCDYNNYKHLINNKVVYSAAVAVLILGCFSAFFAKSPRHAAIEISVFVSLFYFAFVLAGLHQKNKMLFVKQLSWVLWAGIIVYMVAFYAGYLTSFILKIPLLWPLPFTGFDNIRSFNQYQLWSLGLLSLPLLCSSFKKASVTVWLHLALALWWVLLFYSASRGVLLAWLIGMLTTAAVYQKSAWPFLRLQLLNITIGYLCYILLFWAIPYLLDSNLIAAKLLRSSTDDRLALWNQAIILVRYFPLLGAGPMHYPWYNPTLGHPHNSILQLAAEWGLPATIIILSVSIYGLYCWTSKFNAKTVQAKPKIEAQVAILLFFTIMSNAAYSLVDGVIVMPISQVLMFTVIGLMIGHYANENLNVFKNNFKIQQSFAAVILIVLLWSTAPEVFKGLSGSEEGFSVGYRAVGPRFWVEVTLPEQKRIQPKL